jgi:hypothetical protein
MQFRDLSIGTRFDFIDDANPSWNSFYERCLKISARKYRAAGVNHTVGSINAKVYHVEDRSDVLADYREECKADADRTGRRAW